MCVSNGREKAYVPGGTAAHGRQHTTQTTDFGRHLPKAKAKEKTKENRGNPVKAQEITATHRMRIAQVEIRAGQEEMPHSSKA